MGYQLDQVQRGKQPSDFKPMPTVGKGIEELRVWDETGTYRVIHIARFEEAVYEPVNESGAPERLARTASIEAQSAAVARATASICNEEWRRSGRTSGRDGFFHRLYVLHAFQKKTRTTSRHDVEAAKLRYVELMRGRR